MQERWWGGGGRKKLEKNVLLKKNRHTGVFTRNFDPGIGGFLSCGWGEELPFFARILKQCLFRCEETLERESERENDEK